MINAIKRPVQQEFAARRLAVDRLRFAVGSWYRRTVPCRGCANLRSILEKTQDHRSRAPKGQKDAARGFNPGSGDDWGRVPLKVTPDRSDLHRQQQTANRKLITANPEPLRYLYGQNLPATIIATGRACDMATDSATALRTLGQLRGVPAIGGLSRPKSHLGRFSFWYTHWLILLS